MQYLKNLISYEILLAIDQNYKSNQKQIFEQIKIFYHKHDEESDSPDWTTWKLEDHLGVGYEHQSRS
jgi:hypothetical protein